MLNMDVIMQCYEDSEFTDIAAFLYGSDDEEEMECVRGSRPGRMPNLDQDREEKAQILHNDYFCSNRIYPDNMFLRRFRV